MRTAIRALLVVFGVLLMLTAPGVAAIKPDLVDEYLQQQFDWAMYLDVRDVPSYLDYVGSRLHPLTRVRVYFRKYGAGVVPESVQVYEDFWYYKGQVIGLRRRMPLRLNGNSVGAIVVGQCSDGQESSLSACNAIVRVLVDLLMKQAPPGVVMVPKNQFDAIGHDLGLYNFSPEMRGAEGVQTSIHLRSYPGVRDEPYFLQN